MRLRGRSAGVKGKEVVLERIGFACGCHSAALTFAGA